jgi:DNA mismatch repair protein MutS
LARFTSILFPQGGASSGIDEVPECFADLHLDEVIAAVTAASTDEHVHRLFYVPLHEISLVEHRHRVFQDLERDEIRQPISIFVGGMATMQRRLEQANRLPYPLQRQGGFFHAVHTYCDVVASLRDQLARVELTSRGLRDFADYVAEYVDSDTFRRLASDTAAVQSALHEARYTVHVDGLRVNVEKYNSQTDYGEEVVATFERFAGEVGEDYRVAPKDNSGMSHVEEQILGCVAKLYPHAFARLDDFCRRHKQFVESVIRRFDHEIGFYLCYLTIVRRLTSAGVNFSYPEVTVEPGALSADGAFDLALAIKSTGEAQALVGNNFHLSGLERILVVTGPNQGGKTTFARTMGQCAYLASLGCPVPARWARFTLPDRIYTHFDRSEILSTPHGKLEDELIRIRDILSDATATSLIIMNESLSSTTVADALLIGTEILRRIIALRCVAVCVTFLDELAGLDQACVSMVGEVAFDKGFTRTFTFTRRRADGLAYAAALADRHGLNPDVLRRRICR